MRACSAAHEWELGALPRWPSASGSISPPQTKKRGPHSIFHRKWAKMSHFGSHLATKVATEASDVTLVARLLSPSGAKIDILASFLTFWGLPGPGFGLTSELEALHGRAASLELGSWPECWAGRPQKVRNDPFFCKKWKSGCSFFSKLARE